MQHDGSLRSAIHRLTVTPVDDLPRISSFLASSLANHDLEKLFLDSKENASIVTGHRLKTRVTSLLQDRSPSGRISASILIKTLIDNGGPQLLASSAPWARGLLSCLNKSDTPEVKKLYLTTITRLFVLTQDQPSLVREITTPLLPTLISACLNLIRPTTINTTEGKTISVASPLLDTVLECWLRLLPHHPTVFRPFVNRIKPICLSLLSKDDSTETSIVLGTELLCSLLSCAPKAAIVQEWTQASSSLIQSIHDTSNQVLRGVIEEHQSNDPSLLTSLTRRDLSKPPEQSNTDKLGMGEWVGTTSGCIRLSRLLAWLQCLISTPTSQAVPVRLGMIVDTISRLMDLTVVDSKAQSGNRLKFHSEVSREEKEELLLNLPRLHVSCLCLLQTAIYTYGQAILPLYEVIINQMLELTGTMMFHVKVREASYDLMTAILETMSPQHLDVDRKAFSNLINSCCGDLKAGHAEFSNESTDQVKDISFSATATKAKVVSSFNRHTSIYQAAWKLLPIALGATASMLLTRQVRIEADRLSILLNHRAAMLASVMNPALSKNGKATNASILPFLARSSPNIPAVEALLRPRFPIKPVQVSEPATNQPTGDSHTSEDIGNSFVHSNGQGTENKDQEGPTIDVQIPPAEDVHRAKSPLKRPLEELTPGLPSLFSATPAGEEPGPKKPRSDNDTIESAMITIQSDSQDGKEIYSTAASDFTSQVQTEEVFVPASQSIGQSNNNVLNAQQGRKMEIADSDESDFEIPTIDPEMDTDEEEDDED
ncbi:hypothetical protein B0A52_06451 [Exophiala mesophila]|uniref:Pre-rRNA-processing protein RIX1 n=1 Tax=Exophiala mesophila TaxID=212818 RepID=A0A438N299_EXOME|nr:hypothetical protein B0A52_06451 [Exophiala mesophila]